MLYGLSSNKESAERCYSFLCQNNSSLMRVDHFFAALRQYSSGLAAPSVQINAEEIEGLCLWIRLLGRLAKFSPILAEQMVENVSWQIPGCFVELLMKSIPLKLKGHVMDMLAGLAACPSIAGNIWLALEQIGFLPMPGTETPCVQVRVTNVFFVFNQRNFFTD